MKITKLNYELYAIDYLEGNLTKDHKSLFNKFLDKNPEVRQELSDYLEAPAIEEDNSIKFLNKADLLKTTNRRWIWASSLFLFIVMATTVVYSNYFSAIPQNKEETIPYQQNIQQPTKLAVIQIDQPNLENKQEEKSQVRSQIPKAQKTPSTAQYAAIENEIITNVSKSKVVESRSESKTEDSQNNKLGTTSKPTNRTLAHAVKNHVTKNSISTANFKKTKQATILPHIETKAIASIEKPGLISNKKMTFIIDLNSKNESTSKNNKWLAILTPSAYSGINIKNAIASTGLRTTLNNLNIKN